MEACLLNKYGSSDYMEFREVVAEFSCVSERANTLTLKPAGMTFEQATSIPQAAVLALQGLHQNHVE